MPVSTEAWRVGITKTNCLLQRKHLFSYSLSELIIRSISMYLFCNYFIFLSVISLPTALCLCSVLFCACNFNLFSGRYVMWEGVSVKSVVCIFALCYSCTQVTLSYILSCTFTFALTWFSLSVRFLKTALNSKVVKQHCWSAFTFYFSLSIILTVSFINTASSWLNILIIRSGDIHPHLGP